MALILNLPWGNYEITKIRPLIYLRTTSLYFAFFSNCQYNDSISNMMLFNIAWNPESSKKISTCKFEVRSPKF